MTLENKIILSPNASDMKNGNILVTIKNSSNGTQKSVIIATKNPDLVNPRKLIASVLPAWSVVTVHRLTSAKSIKNKTN